MYEVAGVSQSVAAAGELRRENISEVPLTELPKLIATLHKQPGFVWPAGTLFALNEPLDWVELEEVLNTYARALDDLPFATIQKFGHILNQQIVTEWEQINAAANPACEHATLQQVQTCLHQCVKIWPATASIADFIDTCAKKFKDIGLSAKLKGLELLFVDEPFPSDEQATKHLKDMHAALLAAQDVKLGQPAQENLCNSSALCCKTSTSSAPCSTWTSS